MKAILTEAQSAELVKAIDAAEQGSRGEVRVHLERRCPRPEALARAREMFGKLGMQRTRDDTGVLLYVATEDHKVAVFAGKGIHGAAEEGFWQGAAEAVAAGYRAGEPVRGLRDALERIGAILRRHAPGDDEAGNELPNTVTTS